MSVRQNERNFSQNEAQFLIKYTYFEWHFAFCDIALLKIIDEFCVNLTAPCFLAHFWRFLVFILVKNTNNDFLFDIAS